MFAWLLILIAYLPFQIALNISSGADLASIRVFIILLFIIWLFKKQASNNVLKVCFRFLRDVRSVCLLLFLFLAGLSLIGAGNTSWGLRKILFFLSIFPLYFLTIALVDNWLKIRKIVQVMAIGSGLVALIGISQFFGQFVFGLEAIYDFWALNIMPVFLGFNYRALILTYPSWWVEVYGRFTMRAFSIFSDPHMFSFYLGLILPLVIMLYSIRDKMSYRLRGICLSAFLLFALLLTFTRGAYLGVIVSFLVLFFLCWKYLDSKKIPLLLCCFLFVFIIPKTPFASRFFSSFDLTEGSNVGRLEMWQKANQISWENPWQGIGLGNYSWSIDSEMDYRNPITAHNLYLDIFSEMGIFALTVWLVLILATLTQLYQRMKTAEKEQRYLFIALIGSLVYFSVHSFFETAVYSPVVLGILMIILGLSAVLTNSSFIFTKSKMRK